MNYKRLVDDVFESGLVAKAIVLLILANAGILIYWVIVVPLCSSAKGIVSVTNRARVNKKSKAGTTRPKEAPLAISADHPAPSSSSSGKKSVKQLLKERKLTPHAHETLPDTDLFLNSLKGHGDIIVSTDISTDDSRIITACEDNVLRIFHMNGDFANTKPAMTRIPLKETPVRAMFWGANDTVAACTAGLGQVANLCVVPGIHQGRAVPAAREVKGRIHDNQEVHRSCCAASSPGGKPLLATLTKTKEAKVVDGSGNIIATVQPSGIENYQIALSANGCFLAVTTFGPDVKVWELTWSREKTFLRCSKAMELKGHSSGVTCVAFNADATRAATASKDGTLRIWKLDVRYVQQEDPKCLVSTKLHGPPYERMVWCESGVLACAFKAELHFVSAHSGHVLEVVKEAHMKPITDISCSKAPVMCRGELHFVVVTSGKDSKARVWKALGPKSTGYSSR